MGAAGCGLSGGRPDAATAGRQCRVQAVWRAASHPGRAHGREDVQHAASGEPVVRVVKVDGNEIHRCVVIVRRSPSQQSALG